MNSKCCNTMKKVLLLFLSFFYIVTASAIWQRSVTNYTRRDYKAGNQNWMIAQHANGWMYFANNKGLLEYDGIEWSVYPVGDTKARAVKIAPNGRIYIGGMGQFGYFTPDHLGKLNYVSLSDKVRSKHNIGVIWNIHIVDDRVYFQSDNSIFYLEGDKVKVIEYGFQIKYSAIINQHFYIASSQGLLILNGNEFTLLPATEVISNFKIVGLLPFEDKIMIATARNGLFLYDGSKLVPFVSAADSFIKENQLFCVAMKNSLLALGSVQDGLLLLNTRRNEVEKISISNGLQNKTILGLFFDRENNLWLALDNGVDCVHLDSPLFSLYGNRPLIGSGYTSCCYDGKLYLGTNQGLYVTEYPEKTNEDLSMNFIPGTDGQAWSLSVHDNQLFLCSDNGIFVLEKNVIYHIEGLRGVWSVREIKNNPDLLIAGTYNGLRVLSKQAGKFVLLHKVRGFNYSCKTLFASDLPNVFWIANKERGLFRVTLSLDLKRVVKVKNYNGGALPVGNNIYVSKINNDLVVSSRQGIFRYNQMKDCLEPYTWLNKILGVTSKPTPCSYIEQDASKNIWYVSNGALKLLRYNRSTNSYVKNESESYLAGYLIEDFEQVNVCRNDIAIIGTEEGFSLFKFKKNVPKRYPLTLQIRKVYLTGNHDSLVYGRSYNYDNKPLIIPYSKNSIKIIYGVNNYDKSLETFYSYKLTGDRDEGWSSYTENNAKEYTDLKEGDYTFSVKIINAKTAIPIITSLHFKVLPPWYRSVWAYIFYSISLILLMYYTYYKITENKRKLIEQKEEEIVRQRAKFKKESELKDKTIDSLKEEHLQSELRHKSEELVRTTLNIVRKNEILQNIRKEAVGINHSIKEENLVNIRRKTLRLIGQIDTNIEHDDDLKAFQVNFDSVHHEFFTRLEELFPELSSKEKLLCAYIKMNLMSKEIAPLLNISQRGVEIGRYRLRKKLNLKEGESLVEFLQRLTK